MSKIKFVKNIYGDYVPLISVRLELSEKQINLLLDCIDEYERNYERIQRVRGTGFGKHILTPLISKLDDFESLKRVVNGIESK